MYFQLVLFPLWLSALQDRTPTSRFDCNENYRLSAPGLRFNARVMMDVYFLFPEETTEFVCTDSKLAGVDESFLRQMPKVATLSLANNRIESQRVDFASLPLLRNLDLSNNLLSEKTLHFVLPLDAQGRAAVQLDTLGLSGNRFTNEGALFPEGVQVAVKTLDVSNNLFTKFYPSQFRLAGPADRLDLSNNLLKKVDEALLQTVQTAAVHVTFCPQRTLFVCVDNSLDLQKVGDVLLALANKGVDTSCVPNYLPKCAKASVVAESTHFRLRLELPSKRDAFLPNKLVLLFKGAALKNGNARVEISVVQQETTPDVLDVFLEKASDYSAATAQLVVEDESPELPDEGSALDYFVFEDSATVVLFENNNLVKRLREQSLDGEQMAV